MRLWSIHPKYLDKKGLLALWRESLLAKRVLEGRTKGYKNHPQLIRFKNYKNPIFAINSYLFEIYKEAKKRGYNFNLKKINSKENLNKNSKNLIKINSKQIEFEFNHLLNKLKIRDKRKYKEIKNEKNIMQNPIFKIIKGPIEKWEKSKIIN